MQNPVINRIPRDQLHPDLLKAWDSMSRISGEAISVEVMANNPAAMSWYNENFYGQLFHGGMPGLKLDQRTRELIRLRLSKGHGCHVCNSHNETTALENGLTHEQIDSILHPAPEIFDERDRSVIDLAAQIELSNMDGLLDLDLYNRLKAHYDDAAIVEMGMIAAFLTGMAKFLFVFDLVTREESCPIGRPEG